ncbi:armadillo-type protein [Scheffersomyces amazonensis]|uniref:armadillo-type protein n=1 Tax=Scheffersomyces amazonensis TaxID=1078765 RepID=UPI00315CA5B9
MTAYPTRSASISTPEDPSAPQPLAKFSKPGLRSASFGSNFFTKETPSFLPEESANDSRDESNTSLIILPPPEEDESIVKSADLDIVGALGNLDLDEDFDPQAEKAQSRSKSSTPFSQPLYGNGNGNGNGSDNYPLYQPYHPHPHQGSLTPNPSLLASGSGSGTGSGTGSGAATGPFGSNTPSSTWNNTFIPSSAPPFSYTKNAESNELPIFVKPFELPSEESTAKPDESQQFSNLFGGILDSKQPFIPGDESTSKSATATPEADSVNINNTNTTTTSTNINPVDTEKRPIPFHNPLAPQQFHLPDNLSIPPPPMAGFPHPHPHPHQLPHQLAHQLAPAGMWNHQPPLMHPSMGNMFDGRMMPPSPSPAPSHGHPLAHGPPPPHPSMMPPPSMPYMNQFNGNMRNNGGHHHHHNGNSNNNTNNNNTNNNSNNTNNNRHNRGNYGYMNESNIHRKVHNNNNNNNNNRRKGEDASKYANAKLEDFVGQIFNLCKDQHGCRFLQRQLDLGKELVEGKLVEDSSNDKDTTTNILPNDIAATMIFNEIYLKIVELMTDPFGNYLVQKLFENVSVDQRIILVKNSSTDFIRIALDPHGTRALQKLVDCISTEEESQIIIESLSNHIVSLSRDLNGNHVVQKCLQKLKPADNQFIFNAACYNCNEIATHRHGCCVLQRCLDNGDVSQRKQLSLKVAENATNLSLDPFGNYVVQYVLSRGDEESIQIIMNHIKSNIISLSLHKFGSNVIEKSLRINKLTHNIIDELLNQQAHFSELLNDAFGNYVLQTSLDVATQQQLVNLSKVLQPLLVSIKNTPHGRRIMSKIQPVA